MVSVLPQLQVLKGAALDFLFPRFSVSAVAKRAPLFAIPAKLNCSRIEALFCQKCDSHGGGRRHFPIPPSFCPDLPNWESDIDGIRSPFRFEGVIRKAVHEFKYRNLRAVAGRLAQLMGDYLSTAGIPFDVIVPVPLHPKRLRERGYNQSLLLAGELGKITGFPVNDTGLVRKIYNPPQARTHSVAERRQNVIGIFAGVGEDLLAKKVLLVDDVTTSGATLNACAAALKTAGAASVWVLTLAREI